VIVVGEAAMDPWWRRIMMVLGFVVRLPMVALAIFAVAMLSATAAMLLYRVVEYIWMRYLVSPFSI
jgi:ABC-type uncharacterized transport system YnjBCD permease subunit